MATAQASETIIVTDEAWEAIEGAYDLQVHVFPDVVPRRIDDLDLAQEFARRKLKGFVLKSHYAPTYERAKAVTKASNNGVTAYGAITLNHSVGGLNPVALEIAGRSGNKFVWFPTVDALNEEAGRNPKPGARLPFWAEIQLSLSKEGISPPPITVLGENGKLTSATLACIDRIKKHDMVLATGHLGQQEIFTLVRTAKEMGTQRVVVTHAEFPSQNFSVAQQVELAALGAIIEHCFTTMYTNKASWDVYFESVRAVGPERVILSTDLGQSINPPVAEGFGMFAQKMLDAGFSKADIRRMAVINTGNLVS
jgi:hypothetical protein